MSDELKDTKSQTLLRKSKTEISATVLRNLN